MRLITKLLSLSALTVLAFSACSETSNVEPDFEPGMAVVPVMVSAAPGLSTLVVEVSASDITTPLAYNLTMVDGTASDTITIPAGSNRTITVRGYDANNIETHRGSTVTNLTEGSNSAVTVTLDPLAGDQPITVVMGGITVEVSPAVDTVSVGSTIQLTGVVLNDQGDTLEVVPVWSTLNPAVATVDSTGLVTGVSAGQATIVGAYAGVGASAAVSVSDATFPTAGLLTYLTFDGDLADDSGNGRDFTNSGGVFVEDRNGQAASAVSFPTLNAFASRPWTDFPTESFTVAFWGRIEGQALATGYLYFLWGTAPGAWSTGIRMGIDENWQARGCADSSSGYVVYPVINSSGGYLLSPTGCVPYATMSEWRHFVLTSVGGVGRVFIDGERSTITWIPPGETEFVQDSTFTHTTPVDFVETTAWLGRNGNASGVTARIMDNFGVWDRALTPEEIAYLANN